MLGRRDFSRAELKLTELTSIYLHLSFNLSTSIVDILSTRHYAYFQQISLPHRLNEAVWLAIQNYKTEFVSQAEKSTSRNRASCSFIAKTLVQRLRFLSFRFIICLLPLSLPLFSSLNQPIVLSQRIGPGLSGATKIITSSADVSVNDLLE